MSRIVLDTVHIPRGPVSVAVVVGRQTGGIDVQQTWGGERSSDQEEGVAISSREGVPEWSRTG